jgi:hypothetical protein
MRSLAKVWIAVFTVILFTRATWAVSLSASLDRATINLGDSATLSLEFDGGSPQGIPSLPDINGLQIGSASQFNQINIVNGQSSSVFTYRFTLTPQHTGRFTIPAMVANVNGQQVATRPVILTVLKADAPSTAEMNSGNEVAFMKLDPLPSKLYLGQMLTAQAKVYLRDDVEDFGNFSFNGVTADGFAIGKILGGSRDRVQIGNRVYTVIPISIALTANKTGTLTLGPLSASMVIVQAGQSQQSGNPFFQQFFNQGEQRRITLTGDAVSVEALALPDQGKPADFSGAVGNFTMQASVGPTNVLVGDPITVHMQISGQGSLDTVSLPDQSSATGFKLFPPTVKNQITDQLGLQGEKTFEEIVTPQNADVRAWPPFSFSFFNPDDGRYHTLTQPAVPLIIRPAGSTAMPTILANQSSTPENQAPQDILPIKQNPGTFRTKSAPWIAQPVFLALQSLPAIAFLTLFVRRRQMDSLANNPRRRRQRAVALLVHDGLNELKTYAAQNQPDEFFATLFRLLQEQLGERLDCPASAITENVIEEHSILRSAPAATREALRELFQLCNQARYAPVRGVSELNSVAARVQTVIGELQNLKT